jgi:hypothetical protein
MQSRNYRYICIILLAFASNILCAGSSFAKSSHHHKVLHAGSQLTAGHSNPEVIINGNNPFQLVNYRTVKTGHFIKVLLVDLFSLLVCLKYLKNKLKGIYSEYARFLKLLLFPNHVFW